MDSYCSTSYFNPTLQQCSKSYHHLNHSDTLFSRSTICLFLCSKFIQAIASSSLLPPEQGLAYTHPCNWNSVHFTLLKKTVHDCLCNHNQPSHLEKATTWHYLSSLFSLFSKTCSTYFQVEPYHKYLCKNLKMHKLFKSPFLKCETESISYCHLSFIFTEYDFIVHKKILLYSETMQLCNNVSFVLRCKMIFC